MTISIIGLLVALVVICLLYWAITRIMAAFGVGDPIRTVVVVVFVVCVVVYLLSSFGVLGGPLPRFSVR